MDSTASGERQLAVLGTVRRPRLGTIGRLLFGVGVGAVVVVPLLYALFGGFKTTGQILGSAALLPSTWVTTNYVEILTSGDFWQSVLNSFVVALVTVVLTVSFATLAAFVFARFAFRGRELVYAFFTLGLLFP